jgi:hypothetical protein
MGDESPSMTPLLTSTYSLSTTKQLFKMSEPSEDQKKDMYNNLSAEQKHKQTYSEWVKDGYNNQYEKWMPWIEDKYLSWFGNDNKASYATKGTCVFNAKLFQSLYEAPGLSLTRFTDTLNKTKITGIDQVDQLQGDVNNLVGNQVGKGGLLKPIGDMASKEGINRAERGGKDESGSYGGPASGVSDPVIKNAKAGGEGVAGAAQSAGSTVTEGAKGAGGYIGGMFGGGKK